MTFNDILEAPIYDKATEYTMTTQQKPKPIIITNPFGTFEFDPQQIIKMPKGLLGFPEFQQFALANLPSSQDGASGDFRLLQCLDNHDLAFIVFPTTAQNPMIDSEDVKTILLDYAIQEEALALLHIATLRQTDNGVDITLNLKAPIIIDAAAKEGVQHVLLKSHYDTQFSPKSQAA